MGTMGSDRDVVFLSAIRTPFGTFGGSLKDLSATELGVQAARAAVERAGVDSDEYDEVFFGNVIQTSADAVYLARHVGPQRGPAGIEPGPHPQSVVWFRLPGGDRRRGSHSARWSTSVPDRRNGINEPGPSRGSRCPVGTSPGAVDVVRGFVVGGAHGHVLRVFDGPDRGEPRRGLRHQSSGGG